MEKKLINEIKKTQDKSFAANPFKMDASNSQNVSLSKEKEISTMVETAVEMYKRNPEDAEFFVDFCDSLVHDGYSLEHAVDKTDMIFTSLKDEKTYR